MKNSRSILVVTVAVIAVGFFIWLTNSYVLRSNADQRKADITISTSSQSGSSIPLKFLVAPEDAADLVSGADLYVEVTNGEMSSWDGCSNVDGSTTSFTELVKKSGKDARYSCVVLKEAKELPKGIVINGQATCASTNPMKVKILKDKTDVVGPVEGTEYVLDTVAEFDYACGGAQTTPAPTEDITTSFDPDSCSTDVGGTCTFNLKAAATNEKDRISGMYFKLKYDENILDATGIDKHTKGKSVKGVSSQGALLAQLPPTAVTACKVDTDCPSVCANPSACTLVGKCVIPAGATVGACVYTNATVPGPGVPTAAPGTPVPTAVPGSPVPTGATSPVPSTTPGIPTAAPSASPADLDICSTEVLDYKPGEISFIHTCKQAASKLPTSITLPLKFKAIGNGDGDLKIDAVQISGPDIVGPYSVHRSYASYSVGGGTAGNLKLNMKLRMQCVLSKPKGTQTMKVKIGLGDGKLKAPMYQTAEFKADDKGFWNGSVTFKAPAGSGYKILPKGEKHMQKKICVNNPKEDYPGAYGCDKGAITLKDGDNDINFSSIVMLSGDLPPGEQDGISNAKDQSLVRNLIGKSDAESARLADINYDGVVNAVDHSCLIAALAVRWDEE